MTKKISNARGVRGNRTPANHAGGPGVKPGARSKTLDVVPGNVVRYWNHVTWENLGSLIVERVTKKFIHCARYAGGKSSKFDRCGRATWSCNLRICGEGPEQHAKWDKEAYQSR